MSSQYDPNNLIVPKVGDVVEYKKKRMVILKTHMFSFQSDYWAYLLDEELLKEYIGIDMKTEELLSKCISIRYSLFGPTFIPFTKIGTLPLEVQEVSYSKIQLKE